MKARIPHPFFVYASQFTLKSIVVAISYWAFYLTKFHSDKLKMFATFKEYNVVYNGRRYKDKVTLYQTNLIDVMYEVINYNCYGKREITFEEALYLIHLHVNLESSRHSSKNSHTDFMLYLFGNLGEQKRFQFASDFFDDFSREKYILETISKKKHPKNDIYIDFEKEFLAETSISTDDYSALLFVLFVYFCNISNVFNPSNIKSELDNPALSNERITAMLKKYSVSIDEVRGNSMKRQIFYLKPLLEIDGVYISINPFLLLCTFVNSNFWVIRNKYMNANKDTQRFTNAFGKYFEIYFEEILHNCLPKEQFENIQESSDGKRADWHITIGEYHFLVEQKSAISMLGIKQSKPDVEAMKKHILKNWGEAVEQLVETQQFYKLDNAIKIILVYEDYYNSLCLDTLFDLNPNLTNDKNYWLVSIQDFERLIYTYKTDPKKFFKIVNEKIEAERTQSKNGRDLSMFLTKNGVTENGYLEEYGIVNEFKKIENYIFYNK